MSECGASYIATTCNVSTLLSSLRINEMYTVIFDNLNGVIHIIWVPEYTTFDDIIDNLDELESLFACNHIDVEPDGIVFLKVIDREDGDNIYKEYGPNSYEVMANEWMIKSISSTIQPERDVQQ